MRGMASHDIHEVSDLRRFDHAWAARGHQRRTMARADGRIRRPVVRSAECAGGDGSVWDCHGEDRHAGGWIYVVEQRFYSTEQRARLRHWRVGSGPTAGLYASGTLEPNAFRHLHSRDRDQRLRNSVGSIPDVSCKLRLAAGSDQRSATELQNTLPVDAGPCRDVDGGRSALRRRVRYVAWHYGTRSVVRRPSIVLRVRRSVGTGAGLRNDQQHAGARNLSRLGSMGAHVRQPSSNSDRKGSHGDHGHVASESVVRTT